jgi:hypothetical protein
VSFLLYLLGFIVFISGLAWIATLAGLSQVYVLGGALALLAVGVVTAALRRRAGEEGGA